MEPQFCLMFLLMISGALGNEWSVKYSNLDLCAVKGSTVVMEATYTHPTDVTVINRFWFINPVKDKEPTDLRNESGYSGRVEYLGDEQNHVFLRLSDVNKSDEHEYYFRFTTTRDKYQGYPGITLNVTDLQLIAPAELTEGESVILTCETTCSLTDPTFIWYKNTHDLTTNTFKSNELHLQRVSSEDAGSYNCAVRGSEHLHSPAQYLSVRYSPKNVYISPSGEKVEGGLGNLTCSGDANPPVETYTWFKENETSPVGSGQSYKALQSGLYYCEVQNKLGSERSAAVSITITESDGTVIVYVAVGLGLFGLAALLFALFWLRWRRQNNNPDEGDHQNIGMSAKDNTYAALDPAGRKSDDVYHTLAVSHPSPPDDTLTSDYCNKEEVEQMFICYGPMRRGLPAHKLTLSRWIIDAIASSYGSSGLPALFRVREHSTRSVAASMAWSSGVSLQDLYMLRADPPRSPLSGFTILTTVPLLAPLSFDLAVLFHTSQGL
ncbi:B-cell receptor CD22-like, partial [Silurus asotus]